MTIDERGAPDRPVESSAAKPRRRTAPGWAGVRPLLMRLHFYAGVFVGPFLVIAALTGIAYIYTPQVEDAVHDHELHVAASDTWLPLERQVDIAREAFPEGALKSVRPAPTATDTTQVIFTPPRATPSHSQTVFVDPHTGEVRGNLETYGSGQALPVRAWIDVLHRNLHLGEVGRIYSELAASWLGVIVLAGFGLWLSRRIALRRAARRDKPVAEPATGGAAKRGRALGRHAVVGLWAAIGLLFLSATGLTWSGHAGENIGALRSALDWSTPSVSAAVDPSPTGSDVGLDAVRESTLRAGLAAPVEIRVPTAPGTGYVVAQVGRSWPSHADSMAVDPATGQVTDTLRFDDYPLGAKLSKWGIDAHMGFLFGVPNQIVLTLLGLAIVGLVGWGYRMWWLRRPPMGGSRFGRAPARGSWRRAPAKALVPILLVGAALAWSMPVLGVSLLAFLVLDAVIGWSLSDPA
ncbi:PepSY-associated TM helix domain-containing protein [Actinokineospora sp. G85]|uniref:PepSY-associated TM helix domain-containing protein n=1 Tax=Actinokineospora sp. G85 TaxID=3406626 RepID=UPI003C76A71A